jgi:hypothetical protein
MAPSDVGCEMHNPRTGERLRVCTGMGSQFSEYLPGPLMGIRRTTVDTFTLEIVREKP